FGQFMKMNTASSSGTGSLPSNTVPNPREDLNVITTQSGVTLAGPWVSPKEPSPAFTSFSTNSSSKMPEVTKDTVQPSTGSLPSNTVPNPREDLNVITTRSGVTLAGPWVSPKE
nr:hypothetical protein [Tanacetum cinerariifolium]